MQSNSARVRRFEDFELFLLFMAGCFVVPMAVIASLGVAGGHGWAWGIGWLILMAVAVSAMVVLARVGHRSLAVLALVVLVFASATAMAVYSLSAF